MLIGNAIGMACGRNNIDLLDMVAACAGEFLIAIGCAGYGNNHCVVGVAKSRNAVALLANHTAEFATQIASVSLMGASRLKFVENIVALVVRTRQTLDVDLGALNLVVALIGASIVGSGGVVALLESLLLIGPLPIIRQSNQLSNNILCLDCGLWLVGCLRCFGNGERAIDNLKLNIGVVGIGIAEIVSRKFHWVGAHGGASRNSRAAEVEIVFRVDAKFVADADGVTINALLLSVINNLVAVLGDGYHNACLGRNNQLAVGDVECNVAEVSAGVLKHLCCPAESVLVNVGAADACRVARLRNPLKIVKFVVGLNTACLGGRVSLLRAVVNQCLIGKRNCYNHLIGNRADGELAADNILGIVVVGEADSGLTSVDVIGVRHGISIAVGELFSAYCAADGELNAIVNSVGRAFIDKVCFANREIGFLNVAAIDKCAVALKVVACQCAVDNYCAVVGDHGAACCGERRASRNTQRFIIGNLIVRCHNHVACNGYDAALLGDVACGSVVLGIEHWRLIGKQCLIPYAAALLAVVEQIGYMAARKLTGCGCCHTLGISQRLFVCINTNTVLNYCILAPANCRATSKIEVIG